MTVAVTATETQTDSDDEDDSVETVLPRDCYWFIAPGPFHAVDQKKKDGQVYDNVHPCIPFIYGIIVWFFQVSFLLLMILSKVHPGWSANEDVDNPDVDDGKRLATYVPAKNSAIVLFTQAFALCAFLIFREDSLNDFCTGMTLLFNQGWNPFFHRLSCFLRAMQGFMACFTALVLIMTSSDVVDIVLNFTAVNLVSLFDNTAFELAVSGKHGETMRNASLQVEKRVKDLEKKLTNFLYWQWVPFSIVAAMFFGFFIIIVAGQERESTWSTKILRVQFGDSTGLEEYSGCYKTSGTKHDRRMMYYSHGKNDNTTWLAYCKNDRRHWVFFNYNEQLNQTNPCDASTNEVAHSYKTNSFDISTSFALQWFSSYNTPLDGMFFIENVEKDPDIERNCQNFLNDGECDSNFNNHYYNYDGGDCCATTCTKDNCEEMLSEAFETTLVGEDAKGFPYCKDEIMIDLITTLHTFEYNVPDWADQGKGTNDAKWEEIWSPLLKLECNGKMVFSIPIEWSMGGNNQKARVGKSSDCILTVDNFEPIWKLNVSSTIEGSMKRPEIVYRNLIPRDINKFPPTRNLLLRDENLVGTIPPQIGLLNPMLEVLDLSMNALTGTIPSEIALLENLSILDLTGNKLTGTIPLEIMSLENLTVLYLGENELKGSIPKEIGGISSLLFLDLGYNKLTGRIPKEIGLLQKLNTLDLANNKLVGTIPRDEIQSLQRLTFLDLGAPDRNEELIGAVDCANFVNLTMTSSDCDLRNTFLLSDSTYRTPSPTEFPSQFPSEVPSSSVLPSGLPTESVLPSFWPSSSHAPSGSLSAPPTYLVESQSAPSPFPSQPPTTLYPSVSPSASRTLLRSSASPTNFRSPIDRQGEFSVSPTLSWSSNNEQNDEVLET